MKSKKTLALFVVGALTMSLMAGCGSRGDNMIDPNEDPGYGNTDPGYGNTDPGYGNTNPGYGNTNPGTGWGSNPGTGTGMPVALTATVTKKETKRGGFLWLSKYVESVTVQVNNPSQQQVQGTLKVTFTLKGEAKETPEQSITLGPGATQEYTITPSQKADDATAYAESTQNGGGYGATPGTGAGWGTTPGTGTGTGWGTGY